MIILIKAHALATLAMAGVIWFVQVVHYPLMARVGQDTFARYASAHSRRTARVVGPLMIIEALTAMALIRFPEAAAPPMLPIIGLGLLMIIWASTFWLQVPCHRRLAQGFDPAVHRRLVRSNWIRTAAWTLRGLLALQLLG